MLIYTKWKVIWEDISDKLHISQKGLLKWKIYSGRYVKLDQSQSRKQRTQIYK